MYRFLVITCLILSVGSNRADASILTWSTITGYGPTLGSLQYGQNTLQDLFGEITGIKIETNVLDNWTFNLDSTSQLRVSVNSLDTNPDSLLSTLNLDGYSLNRAIGSAYESWLFEDTLGAGAHTINIRGLATFLGAVSGYEVNVSATTAVVPLPGLGWIVGTFFFMIFNRRASPLFCIRGGSMGCSHFY